MLIGELVTISDFSATNEIQKIDFFIITTIGFKTKND